MEPTDEHWNALRNLLKQAILANEIPLDSKLMRPKQVWQKYYDADHPDIQTIDYNIRATRDKFTRLLRALRKKHKDGDLENEGQKAIEWGKSAAKQYLKKCFRLKVIPTDYDNAEAVFNNHCKNDPSFARMQYDAAFVRRLKSVRDDYIAKFDRCQKDLEAFIIAKQNHPTPALNCRGEPQWNGSNAQKLLKELIGRGDHEGKKPENLWASTPDFQVYSKESFRDHIYQEQRLLKFNRYVETLKQQKFDALQY